MTEAEPTVKLKNGTTEAEPLVVIMMFVLERLFDEEPIRLYELVAKCRDRDYKMFGNNGDRLVEWGLVGPPPKYAVHESQRNIILSAVEDEGTNLRLVSPIA